MTSSISYTSCYPEVFLPEHESNISQHLDKYGYVVVKVMDETEIADIRNDVWTWLENLGTGIDRININTTIDVNEKWPEQTKGIINSYGIGQSKFMWKSRVHDNVIRVFQSIWDVRDLITSFDGACIMPLTKDFTIPSHEHHTTWAHRDQSPSINVRMCVQGGLSIYDNLEEHDGGFVVWEGSHTIDWTTIDEKAKHVSCHWYRIKNDSKSMEYLNGNCPVKIIRVPAGTMILWDSRTIHENIKPTIYATNPRIVLLICMTPRSFASKDTLQKRHECFMNHKTTTHVPHELTICPDTLGKYSKNKVNPKSIISLLPLMCDIITNDRIVYAKAELLV